MLNFLRFIFLTSLVVWMGMLIFFTFFVAPSIFKVLPRELAGDLVGDIFPKYWMIGYIAGILTLASLIGMSIIEKAFPAIRIAILALMTAITFYSGLVLFERARAVMVEVKASSDPVKKEELRKNFKKIHIESAVLNMAVMISGLAVVLFVSRNLRL
ncbi:MAG: DUF4149 domain-containing protein [Deltaproteobacteria bacterium]|nr:DUF4149 domain-containing protein [Deltaproteobacteria bacterium]